MRERASRSVSVQRVPWPNDAFALARVSTCTGRPPAAEARAAGVRTGALAAGLAVGQTASPCGGPLNTAGVRAVTWSHRDAGAMEGTAGGSAGQAGAAAAPGTGICASERVKRSARENERRRPLTEENGGFALCSSPTPVNLSFFAPHP